MAQAISKARLKPRTRVDQQGRIVIPAEIRQELGLEPGEPVSLLVEDGVLKVMSFDRALKRVQEMARQITGGREGLVDEFIADRHREAERE